MLPILHKNSAFHGFEKNPKADAISPARPSPAWSSELTWRVSVNIKTILYVACSVLSLQSTLTFAREGTGIIQWSWSGTTRNDQRMYEAAYAAACPTGPEYFNQELVGYTVTGTDSQNRPGRGRKFKAWGYTQCFFDRVEQTPPPPSGPEMPDLSGGTTPPWWSGGSSEGDDSGDLGQDPVSDDFN
jgi:hypothetical protein